VSQFPHPDIDERMRVGRDGKPHISARITPTISPYTRDDPEYWLNVPSDHSVEGLFVDATKGDNCNLAKLINFTFCVDASATADGRRKRYVTDKGREAQRQVSNGGRYSRPVKPANSGRKRRAA
jgi:hypothetical protein